MAKQCSVDISDLRLALTSADKSQQFRNYLDPLYKAHRKQVRPQYWEDCRNHLLTHYKDITRVGTICEADDILAMSQTKDTCIASSDKDLLQIPGLHFNFVKNIFTEVDERQANINFWKQFLIGDAADNIKGIDGIGEAKASKYLKDCNTYEEGEEVVKMYYDDNHAKFILNYNLLRLWRKPFQLYNGETIITTEKEQFQKELEKLQRAIQRFEDLLQCKKEVVKDLPQENAQS